MPSTPKRQRRGAALERPLHLHLQHQGRKTHPRPTAARRGAASGRPTGDSSRVACLKPKPARHRFAMVVMRLTVPTCARSRPAVGGVCVHHSQSSRPSGATCILFGVFQTGTRERGSVAGRRQRYSASRIDAFCVAQRPCATRALDARHWPGALCVSRPDQHRRHSVIFIAPGSARAGEVALLTNDRWVAHSMPEPRARRDHWCVRSTHAERVSSDDAGPAADPCRPRFDSSDAHATARAAGEFDGLRRREGLAGIASIGFRRPRARDPAGVGASLVPIEGARPDAPPTAGLPQATSGLHPGVDAPEAKRTCVSGLHRLAVLPAFTCCGTAAPRLGASSVGSGEMLDRQSLFFGGSYGTDGEFGSGSFDFTGGCCSMLPRDLRWSTTGNSAQRKFAKINSRCPGVRPLLHFVDLQRYERGRREPRFTGLRGSRAIRNRMTHPPATCRAGGITAKYNIFIELPSTRRSKRPGVHGAASGAAGGGKYFVSNGDATRALWCCKSDRTRGRHA